MWQTFLTVIKRTIALTIGKVAAVLTGASLIGVATWQAALMAATVGVLEVAEDLSNAYLEDGKIDPNEINNAFRTAGKKK
jgi:hypothetical protein